MAVHELEISNRGWFETDEDFRSRMRASLQAPKAGAGSGVKSSSSKSASHHITVTTHKSAAPSAGHFSVPSGKSSSAAVSAGAKSVTVRTTNAFSALDN